MAALHPLEYDPDDKLTFSVGMGNYAGENAAMKAEMAEMKAMLQELLAKK